MTTLIIVFGMLTAFYSGFYFGYLKREGKPPELPQINLKEVINAVKPEPKPSIQEIREQAKANNFYS